MKNYQLLLLDIMTNGVDKPNRTGVDTRSVFGRQLKFNLNDGFPLITTKKMHTKSIIHELLWIISGSTNIKYLKDNGVTIWDEWAKEDGDLGPVYGHLLRNWNAETHFPDQLAEPLVYKGVDQLQNVINMITTSPNDRRMIITLWHPEKTGEMALPPCHGNHIQFYVAEGKLSCMMTQRSVDTFLGLPFNIASYALFTHMIAHVCKLGVDTLTINLGDTHIYHNHFDQAREQLSRTPKPLPKLKFAHEEITNIDDFKYSDVIIEGYESHPAIKADVAV